MLSPNWKSVWGGSSQAKAYSLLKDMNDTGSPKLRKIAILMTDGVYNTYRGWKDQDIKLQSTNAIAMCAEMKKKGIEIYTVGFGLNELTAKEKAVATATLKSCGTDIAHFYSSINTAELVKAFETIGKKVDGLTPENLGQNEEFQSVVASATEIAMRNHRQEKLEALRNIVKHTAEGLRLMRFCETRLEFGGSLFTTSYRSPAPAPQPFKLA
jgi:hypothetical protein